MAVPAVLIGGERRLRVRHCLLCGWYFGEATLDWHHGFLTPPPPRQDSKLPVWDPARRRLQQREVAGYFTLHPDPDAA